MTPTRYPLQWPIGWKRTPEERRTDGKFATRGYGNTYSDRQLKDITVTDAVRRLLAELQRFAVAEPDIVISTNLPTRLDGFPRGDAKKPADPGAAVYWLDLGGQHRCMAIDRYSDVAQNIAALAATIEAMRAIERHGGAIVLERAFTGFTALPAPIVVGMKRDWWDVLQCKRDASTDVIKAQYRRLASDYHPDKGGDPAKMADLNAARDEALKEIAP